MTILLSIFLLLMGSKEAPATNESPSLLERSSLDEKTPTAFHQISHRTLYFGAGAAFGSASILARLGWGICLISPWASTVGNECHLLSDTCGSAAQYFLTQMCKGTPSLPSFFQKNSIAYSSWHLYKTQLSQIPAFSNKEKQLLLFLEKQWLAKSTGTYPVIIDWICPCFGISVQVHPETTNSYARDPWNKASQTYKNRVEDWKKSLPHPHSFPLILTRAYGLQDYLPSYIDVPQDENIQITVERVALRSQTKSSKVVVDLTSIFQDVAKDSKKWIQAWKAYQAKFSTYCKEHHLDLTQILCIQRVKQEEIGGIRVLPWAHLTAKEVSLQHQFLLEWVSKFGLSANRIELNRWDLPSNTPLYSHNNSSVVMEYSSKEELVSYLNFLACLCINHPQKSLMLQGMLQALKGLLAKMSEDKWNETMSCPTRASLTRLSFFKIKEQLNLLTQENDETSFFDTASHIEQIHANLLALLEIFTPFTPDDFPKIYQDLLTSIPQDLKALTSCGVHSSGMTSLAGIFKAVERTILETAVSRINKPLRILYGDNIYYENIHSADKISNASSMDEATEQDWKDVDLLLAQFNPALKRVDFQITEYKVERIAEALSKALNAREKPLTLAIDCTFDYINSPRVSQLLLDFQEQIKAGALNIICYRSGLKFDLFGMDNYCGAPFYMIHNQEEKWTAFDRLLTDPALQADRLSLNWFCLAYQNAAPQLELYRKQIFDNTRALLNTVPSRLLNNKNADYQIIPIESDADPAFIDIKIYGPLHQIRGGLVAGFLTLKCMAGKHPLFQRPSVGFYHPNLSMIFSKKCSTIRLTLGLDPAQVALLAECFETVDALNGPNNSNKIFRCPEEKGREETSAMRFHSNPSRASFVTTSQTEGYNVARNLVNECFT